MAVTCHPDPPKKKGAAADGIQGVARKRWDTCDIMW
jgi:hypothetical protein